MTQNDNEPFRAFEFISCQGKQMDAYKYLMQTHPFSFSKKNFIDEDGPEQNWTFLAWKHVEPSIHFFPFLLGESFGRFAFHSISPATVHEVDKGIEVDAVYSQRKWITGEIS